MIENRNDLLENKKTEIASIIKRTCNFGREESINAEDIMQDFIEDGSLLITPPQQEPVMLHMLTIDSLQNYSKGESIKPGNIKLNIHRLIEHLPDLVTNVVELNENISILKVCAALNIWKMIRDIVTVEITKEQAIVIVALWRNCDKQQRITLEQGFTCFKLLYIQMVTSECTWEQYIKLISDLEKIGCLKLDTDGIWLCERVSMEYTR